MQIHELPTDSPTIADDYLAIDDGVSTRKTLFSGFEAGNNNVTFTSGDSDSPGTWQTVSALASGTLSSLMTSLSKMASNTRYLFSVIGSTVLSTVAQTVTGAINELVSLIGNTPMQTTAQTLTGAIAEHESDITNLRTVSIGEFSSTHTLSSMSLLARYGRIVFTDLVLTTTSAVSNYETLATLPVGYRPIAQCFGLTSSGGRFDVTYSGLIRAVDSVTSGTTLYITITYISQA